MADIRRIVERVLLFFLPLIYGWIIILFSFVKIIKHGKKFFQTEIVEAPKILYDAKLGKHEFAQLKNQGIRLHYVESGNRNKPLVLLLHGFPDFWFSWKHQIPKLAQNYWVVAVDLRGYGESDRPSQLKAYTIDVLVEDVKELIASLGKDSAIVVGHDWGGVIAWYLGISYPEKVGKLVALNAPHPAAFTYVISNSWKQFFMSWYMFFFQLPYLPEAYLRSNNLSFIRSLYQKRNKKYFSDEDIQAYKHVFSQPGALTPPINYYRASLRNLNDKKKKYEKVAIPTLIVWGDRDVALSTELVKASIKHCSNVKIEMIEGAGHWVHHEQPEIVNKHVENFLKN